MAVAAQPVVFGDQPSASCSSQERNGHDDPLVGGQPRLLEPGDGRDRELTAAGGFNRFRRAAETPFNLVYEVRP
jgi:hypothetical protein